jgi:hypothetical protein
MTVVELTPLEDPDYKPKHPPVDGKIPDIVARWGKTSQLRWFERYANDLNPRQTWSVYWCQSEFHRGLCCTSCYGELEDGYHGGGVMADGWCCCRDSRMSGRTS